MLRMLHTHRLFAIILALGLFGLAVRNVTDPDVWWHLRTGQWIVQTHSVPRSDPFSFTRFGQPWVAHEWLSEVLIYSVYRVAGWGGLITGFATIIAASLLLAFIRCPGRPYVAALATIWGAAASAPTWGVRPQMFSFLFAALFLLLLEKSDRRPNVLWWVVPLTLLWVNLHGAYFVGSALLILFLVGGMLDVAFGFEEWRDARPRLRRIALMAAACVAVVPLNPNGARMYWYPLETLRFAAMQRQVHEWLSPNFHAAKQFPLLLMLLAIMAVLPFSTRRLRPRELLLLVVMTGAALHSNRHVAIFVLVAVPILSGLAEGWLGPRGLIPQPGLANRTAVPAKLVWHAVVLAAFVVFTGVRVRSVINGQEASETHNFPAAAVSFLLDQRPPGPILNHYDWGGYFIWKLYPVYQVYIDGRADLYEDALLQPRAATYYLTDHWQEPFEHWGIRTVVLPPDAPLVTALRSDPAWKQIYVDGQAAILTRTR